MEHKPVVYTLLSLHTDLADKLRLSRKEAVKVRAGMKHVEAVIKLLDPTYDARRIAVRRRYNPNPLFKRGTIFRAALGILRTATAPMSAEEIAVALLRSKGVHSPTRDETRFMYGAVNASLRGNAGKSVTATEGRPRRWGLALVGDGDDLRQSKSQQGR